MLTIINGPRLTRQPFFQDLIAYLQEHETVILRDIKREFATVNHLDRQLDSYIQAGYIHRENKRYFLGKDLLETVEELALGQEVWVDTESSIYQELSQLTFQNRLTNETNAVVIIEEDDFLREKLTLSNYFYRMKEQLPPSEEQAELYGLLGDVNPTYALKYMTTFLLKFARKAIVIQKRQDIFVQALVILGYIRSVDETSYELTMDLDVERLEYRKTDG